MAWIQQQLLAAAQARLVSVLIEALAWPAAMVIIAAMFRAEVRLVLDRIVRLKYHDFEAQFRRDLGRTEELAAASEPPRRLLDVSKATRRVFHEVDTPSPSTGHSGGSPDEVQGSWSSLEAAIAHAAGPNSVDPVRTLVERGTLGGPTLLLYERLRTLHRDVLAHADWHPADDEVRRLADLARTLASRLPQSQLRNDSVGEES